MKDYEGLQEEADYWNNEYKRCFGHPPIPAIGIGVDNSVVHRIQSAVIRHNNELLKQGIAAATALVDEFNIMIQQIRDGEK